MEPHNITSEEIMVQKYKSEERRWSNSIIEDFRSLYFQDGLYLFWQTH